MKSHQKKRSCSRGKLLKLSGGLLTAASLVLASAPLVSAEVAVSGQSDTILRVGQTLEKKDIAPLYEYLRLSLVNTEKDGSAVSLHVGGWARGDLADKSGEQTTAGDLQYGYVSYQGAKNNLQVNAGRQFVTEGVATERIDGFYARNGFLGGVTAAAFFGAPVVTEPTFKAGDMIVGGRLSQSMSSYYTLGVSALKSTSDGTRYREEEGVDLWLHPAKQLDLAGRSSYNSITKGWMEHAYTLSCIPFETLRISADVSNINYRDYFYRTTTSAFLLNNGFRGVLDPREKVLAVGGMAAWSPFKNLTLSGDYRNYNYKIQSSADYYGGKAVYAIPGSFSAGFSLHRMDGRTDRLNYYEYRGFLSKKIAHLDLTLDFIDLNYDSRVNGLRNTYTFVGDAAYEVNHKVTVAAVVDYSKNPDFNSEVRGLFRLTYVFDSTRHAEGGRK